MAATTSTANLIEANATGVNFSGEIRFNRIARNTIGIFAQSGHVIDHNLIYRNTNAGVLVSGKSDVQVVQNTFYSPTGDLLRMQGGSSDVEVRNNIFWAEARLRRLRRQRQPGRLLQRLQRPARDRHGQDLLLDEGLHRRPRLQADVAFLDLHSIGRTAVNPRLVRAALRQPRGRRLPRLRHGRRAALEQPDGRRRRPSRRRRPPRVCDEPPRQFGFESGVGNWSVNPGGTTKTATPSAYQGGSYFFSGSVASGFAEQTINLVTAGYTAAQLDSNDFALVFGGRVRSLAETPADQGQITLTFLDANGNAIGVPLLAVAPTPPTGGN